MKVLFLEGKQRFLLAFPFLIITFNLHLIHYASSTSVAVSWTSFRLSFLFSSTQNQERLEGTS